MTRFSVHRVAAAIVGIGLLAVLSGGCYATYTGVYWITRANHSPSAEFDGLDTEIGRGLAPLGFKRQPLAAPHVVWFLKEASNEGEAGNSLAGSDARMTVAIDLEDLTIAVRDLSNSTETPFNQLVKETIEETMKSSYAVSGLVFERQWDTPFPN